MTFKERELLFRLGFHRNKMANHLRGIQKEYNLEQIESFVVDIIREYNQMNIIINTFERLNYKKIKKDFENRG